MHSRLLVAGLLGALALGGCHRSRTTTPDNADGKGDDGGGGGRVQDLTRRAGAGHTANIDMVAVSHDGAAALTRDQIGAVRLWPRLDGSVEPIVIPVQGATTLSVAARGKDAHTVAVVDPSGSAKIFGVDARGEVEEIAALPPFAPLYTTHVLPGGERILALFKDHSIRILDTAGKELGRFDERKFRATDLVLASDGKMFVAITKDGTTAKLQRIAINGDAKPTMEPVGAPREIKPTTALTPSGSALSPDAKRWAWVDRVVGNAWEIAVADLGQASGETRFSVTIPAHLTPNIGFASAKGLLVSASDGSLSWLIDPDDGAMRPRGAAPQDFVNQGRAQAVAGGVQVAAHGTWLFVHDVAKRSHVFLGYRTFQAQSVAVSPSGKYVAWAHLQGPLLVEPTSGDTEPSEIPSDDAFGTFRVRFVDEDHVLSIDGAGGIRLYEWRTARLVAHVGVNGGVRNAHFDPQRGVLLVERHNNDGAVYKVSPKGFEGPWIIADSSFRCGLLGRKGDDEPIVWTLDSANRLRRYTMKELTSDLTREQIERMGKDLEAGKVAPLAIDRLGRQYGVRWNGTTMELFVDFGKHLKSVAAPSGDISQIIPSDDGTKFIAVHQRGNTTSLSMHEVDTLQEKWSYSTGVFNNEVIWSPDGSMVAIAANSGAALLEGATGKPVVRRCGIEFRAAGSPPASAFNGVNLRSLCEQ